MIIRENKILWSTIKVWEREGDDEDSDEDEGKNYSKKRRNEHKEEGKVSNKNELKEFSCSHL